jgi:hypothetical protein
MNISVWPRSIFWLNDLKKTRTKRYVLVFETWGNPDMKPVRTINEYDTTKGWKEEAALIDECYADTPKPREREREWNERTKTWNYFGDYSKSDMHSIHPYNYVFDNDAKFWGYVVLDFELQNVVKFGGEGIKDCYKECFKDYHKYQLLDAMFRGEDEVPKGYKWDDGEYKGWLRFRWGDGKNSVDYRPPRKCGIHTCETYSDEEENYLDQLEEEFSKAGDREWIVERQDRW